MKQSMHKTLLSLMAVSAICSAPAYSAQGPHNLGVFAGITHSDSESDYTLGLEYEFRYSDIWGVGLTYENAPDAHHDDGVSVLVGSVYFHPDNHWRLGAGLGRERVGGDHSHTENLTRVSAAYDFHLDGFGVSPSVAVDFVDGDSVWVVGMSFIKSF